MNNEIPTWSEEDLLVRLSGLEEILESIVKIYLNDNDRLFALLEDSINALDAPNLIINIHSLKGTSALVSALKLTHLAAELEIKINKQDYSTINEDFEAIKEESKKVKRVLTAYLSLR